MDEIQQLNGFKTVIVKLSTGLYKNITEEHLSSPRPHELEYLSSLFEDYGHSIVAIASKLEGRLGQCDLVIPVMQPEKVHKWTATFHPRRFLSNHKQISSISDHSRQC